MEKYHKYVFIDGNECHLTEKHKDISPVLIDLDFRFDGELKGAIIKIGFKNLYLYTWAKFQKIMQLSQTTDIFVMEKDTPIQDKAVIKDGIHIIIPSIVTEPKVQFIVRSRMIKNPECVELMKSIDCKNDINDIIDLCVIERNNWQFYGSKKPNNIPYKVTKIFKRNNSNKLLANVSVDTFTNKDFLKLFSIRNKTETKFKPGQEGIVTSLYKDLELKFKTNKKGQANY